MNHMTLRVITVAFAVLNPAVAFSQVQEVLVTGSLIRQAYEAPHVTLARRADNLISNVRVVCDTRDLSQRQEELRETLLNMIQAAALDPTIELGLAGNEIVGEFDETMLDAVIRPDTRADTSFAVLTVKTSVTVTDTFDLATGRVTDFIEQTPMVGRSEILRTGDWNLTLVGPELSRETLLQMIAEDSTQTAQLFGLEYEVDIGGLQFPVAWYRSGPLDLSLFIPYEMRILPAR